MASYSVDVELQVKIDKLRAELEKIPGISARESKKMARAWSRDYNKVEKSAERAARQAERQAERVREGWKSAGERTASLMGGVFGDISDSVLDLGDRMAGVADDMGGLAGGATLAAGAVGALTAATVFGLGAMLEWMDSIDDVRESLERVRGVPPLSPEHEQALLDYQEAARDADAAIAAATLSMQADFAPALQNVQHALVGVSATMTELTGESWSLSDALTSQARSMANAGILSALAVQAYDYFVDVGAEAAAEIEHVSEAQHEANQAFREGADDIRVTSDELNEYAEALGYTRESYVDLDEAARRQAEAAREAAREQAQAAREYEQMWSKAAQQEAKRTAEARKMAEERAAAIAAEVEAQQELVAEAAVSLEEMTAQLDETFSTFQQEVFVEGMDQARTLAEETLETIDMVAEARMDALVRQENQARRAHAKEQERLKTERERIEEQIEQGKISEREGRAQIRRIDKEMRANAKARRQQRRDHRQALKDAHKAQQAAAIARATIDAAANAVALTGALAYLQWGAPIAAAAIAGAQLTAQVAVIKSTKAPKFASGGMVRDRMEGDHAVISAEPDEGILTRRGVRNVGGPEGVAALNAGRAAATGGGGTRVYLDSRLLGEVVARVIETDERVTTALQRRTGAIPGMRS